MTNEPTTVTDRLFEEAMVLANGLSGDDRGCGASVQLAWAPYTSSGWVASASWSSNYTVYSDPSESPTDAVLSLLDRLREEKPYRAPPSVGPDEDEGLTNERPKQFWANWYTDAGGEACNFGADNPEALVDLMLREIDRNLPAELLCEGLSRLSPGGELEWELPAGRIYFGRVGKG